MNPEIHFGNCCTLGRKYPSAKAYANHIKLILSVFKRNMFKPYVTKYEIIFNINIPTKNYIN